jgi:hypothetical protein
MGGRATVLVCANVLPTLCTYSILRDTELLPIAICKIMSVTRCLNPVRTDDATIATHAIGLASLCWSTEVRNQAGS